MSPNERVESMDVRAAFYGHRFARYKGCAPHWDPELAGRALGDESLSLDAWSASSQDGGEPQRERLARERAAKRVCASCPVLVECRAYANSETVEGRLAEPDGIWGGELALDRHRALIARRAAVAGRPSVKVLAEARTVQKRAVLAALARETDEELVAFRAGMDVRTANWHRSLLCTLLGLNKETATRGELLEVAAGLGLLPKRCRIVSDGRWPVAAAPTTDGARQRRIAAGAPQQLVLDLWPGMPVPRVPRVRRTLSGAPSRRPGVRRARLRVVRATFIAEALPFPSTPAARTAVLLGAAA